MAEASVSWAEDQFCCSVCLDLLKDPVTIPCGHSYCMSCITDCWDQENQKGIYKCPQCREVFRPRPVLKKNVMFAEMVEKVKKTRKAPPVPPRRQNNDTGAGDVQCGACTGIKRKAVKSCLDCCISYCQNHLEQHEGLFGGKGHNLTNATGRLKEMICTRHNKPLDIYCRTDQQCICILCLVDEHKNHDTVSIAAARTEKQKQFEETQRNIQKKIQQRKKDLQQISEAVKSHKRSAQTAVEDSEKIFTELIRSIQKHRSEVTQMIRDQERAAVSRAEERMARLELELDDLRWKDNEMKQLSETQDHVQFLKGCPSVSLSGSTDNFTVSSRPSFDEGVKTISQFRDKLQQFCTDEMEKVSKQMKAVQVIVSCEYATRKEFLQYSNSVTLDLNSVNYSLRLSEGNTVITFSEIRLPYRDHPDRFDSWTEVMCQESLTGRCYWEVEWAGEGSSGVDIGVAYRRMKRKGDGLESAVGRNGQSWSLFCCPDYCSFWHNNIETVLPVTSVSSRIGVYVDHSAGVLSFYSVSDSMSLIHRVQTTFTQQLYAVFGIDRRTALRLSNQLSNSEILKIALLYHSLMMS